ncbi:MAG: zinc-ribbon domain-containing protein [Candidatus Thorarchaeota archaeon]
MPVQFCPNCGQKVDMGSQFCFNCGYSLDEAKEITNQQPYIPENNFHENNTINYQNQTPRSQSYNPPPSQNPNQNQYRSPNQYPNQNQYQSPNQNPNQNQYRGQIHNENQFQYTDKYQRQVEKQTKVLDYYQQKGIDIQTALIILIIPFIFVVYYSNYKPHNQRAAQQCLSIGIFSLFLYFMFFLVFL